MNNIWVYIDFIMNNENPLQDAKLHSSNTDTIIGPHSIKHLSNKFRINNYHRLR